MATVSTESFGQRVRRLRIKQGIRQTDLAASARMSWRHLIRIEQDRGGVTKPATAARLAEALGVSTVELTGETDEDEEAEPMSLDHFLELRVRQILKTQSPPRDLAVVTGTGSDNTEVRP